MSQSGWRTRAIQIGALALISLLSLGALLSAFTAWEVRGLSGDVHQAESHLPETVDTQLVRNSGGMLDENQVTLVSYSSGIAKGTTVLFATAPGSKFSSILSISPGVRIGSGRHVELRERKHPPRGRHPHPHYRVRIGMPLRDLTTKQTIAALGRAGIPVSHVALIDAKDVGPLVDAVGGITVDNKQAFTAAVNGRTEEFKQGTLQLDGPSAAAYVHAATTRETLDTAENAALVGIIHAVLSSSSVSRMRSIGQGLAQATATDLSTADVIGLVEIRLRGGELVDCRLTGPGNLAQPQLAGVVNEALGRKVASASACQVRHLAAAPVVPPTIVVTAVQHYGWQLFVGLAMILAFIALALSAVLKAQWPASGRYA